CNVHCAGASLGREAVEYFPLGSRYPAPPVVLSVGLSSAGCPEVRHRSPFPPSPPAPSGWRLGAAAGPSYSADRREGRIALGAFLGLCTTLHAFGGYQHPCSRRAPKQLSFRVLLLRCGNNFPITALFRPCALCVLRHRPRADRYAAAQLF
ncbi:Multimerin-2, partial [Frankliniella fusca]